MVLQGVWQEGTGDYYVERKQIVLVAGAKTYPQFFIALCKKLFGEEREDFLCVEETKT